MPDFDDLIRRARSSEHAAALLARFAPGGDRTNPAAREWVRRWTPSRAKWVPAAAAGCTCASGRCGYCN